MCIFDRHLRITVRLAYPADLLIVDDFGSWVYSGVYASSQRRSPGIVYIHP